MPHRDRLRDRLSASIGNPGFPRIGNGYPDQLLSARASHYGKAAALLALVCLTAAPGARGAPDSVRFIPAFDTDLGNKFNMPALLAEVPGRPGSFVVPEIGSGNIYLLTPVDGGYAKTVFATVKGAIGELDMGLTGFAFHPDFARNGKYYVKRGLPTASPRQNVLEERIATASRLKDSGLAPRRVLTIDEPAEYRDHNGGSPVFGPDGYLYLGLGDGGWDLANPDPHGNGQNLKTVLGKIIRIDVDRKDPGLEYAIPPDNPFADEADPEVRKEIWAYGLRNPFRLAFDHATGELYAGDVGSDHFEEVNLIKKGRNYGWSIKEGSFCLPAGPCPVEDPALEEPVLFLKNGRAAGQSKCLIGGVIYRGDPGSPFYGAYFFGDHSLKRVYAFSPASSAPATAALPMGNPPESPLSFTLDRENNIYLVTYEGYIYRLDHPWLARAPMGMRRPDRAASRKAGWRTAFAAGGRLSLPGGMAGTWDAYSPSGAWLGQVDAGGKALLRAEGLVLLRPSR